MSILLVSAGVLAGGVIAACLVAIGLAIRATRAQRFGRERSDLAGAPERMRQRDLPELPTRRISKEDLR